MDEVLKAWHGHRKALKRIARAARKATKSRKARRKTDSRRDKTVARGHADDGLLDILKIQKRETVRPLPRTVADLEKDWLRWARASYPAHDPGLPPYPAD